MKRVVLGGLFGLYCGLVDIHLLAVLVVGAWIVRTSGRGTSVT